MTRGKPLVGGLVLCALLFCSMEAASASAATLTAVKCVKVGAGKKYANANCSTPAGGGEYETVPLEEITEIEQVATTNEAKFGSTAKPVVVMEGTVGGAAVVITCGAAKGTGQLTNAEGETPVHGSELVFKYSECHASPKNKPTMICTVKGTAPVTEVGELETEPLTTTVGPEHNVTLEPSEGTTFTKFNILGAGAPCFTSKNLGVTVGGTLVGLASTETHSHLTFNATTNGATFEFNGAKATYESTETGWMKGNEAETVGLMTI